MTIARVTDSTQICAGKIVLCKVVTDLCGHPRLVTRDVTGSRVFFKRLEGDLQDKEDFMLRHTIAFICDTREEAQQLRALSNEQASAYLAAANKVRVEFAERLQALMGNS
jgi:hypothetical protein